jgi:capsular exopolysaccharide synthesis family protein
MISVVVGMELKTPIYTAQVKMLISAEKLIESPYYKVLGGYQQTEISLTQSEIVNSNPVIERAVKALMLDQRPFDYEKNYCSPLKAYLIDLWHTMSKPAVDLISSGLKASNSNTTLPENEQSYPFRLAVESLKANISVDPIRDTNLFTITASDFNPRTAAMIANVVSRSYIIFDLEQQLAELQLQYGEKHPTVAQLKDNISKMIKNLTGETLSNIEAIGPASVKIVEQAQVPLQPTGTNKRITLLIAFFMSPFLGVMIAFGFEYLDHTFKSPQDVEAFLNLPLLGSIPKKGFKDKTLIKDSKRMIAFTPAYQNLSDQIYLLMKDKGLKSILMTAPSPSDGSTTIIANLANFLSSKAGHKVMVIDANLRAPTIHKVFNISGNTGLANVLEGKVSLEAASHELSANLTVLPAGNTTLNSTPLLDSARMANIISLVKEKYELIFIDYANLRNFKDACVLCPYLDGIALVVSEGKTRRHVLKELLMPLKHKKANLIGVVLNNRTFAIPKMIYERV